MLEVIGQLRCADRVLHDPQELPEALRPAAASLHRWTDDLDRPHTLTDRWSTGEFQRSSPAPKSTNTNDTHHEYRERHTRHAHRKDDVWPLKQWRNPCAVDSPSRSHLEHAACHCPKPQRLPVCSTSIAEVEFIVLTRQTARRAIAVIAHAYRRPQFIGKNPKARPGPAAQSREVYRLSARTFMDYCVVDINYGALSP